MKYFYKFIFLLLVLSAPTTYAQNDSKSGQPKPIETTVCKIMEAPSNFNNKLVKVRGYVSVSFEYSTLQAEGCSDALWFAIADGSGPPGLVITVNGLGRPRGRDRKGRPIKPLPVKLIRDSNYSKFEHYMTVKAEQRPCVNDLLQPTPLDCAVDRVTATFIGRLDSISKRIHAAHLRRSASQPPDHKGFGQMGMFDAQLVLQSVEDVDAVDSFGRSKP